MVSWKKTTQLLKDVFNHPTFEKFTSLKWASKTLAIILSSIVVFLLIGIVGLAILGAIYAIIERLPYFIFLIISIIVLLGVLGVGMILIPPLWKKIVRSLTIGNGKQVLLWVIVALWFFVMFHKWIYETSVNYEIALMFVLTGLVLWIVTVTLLLATIGRSQILAGIGGYVCLMVLYAGIYNLGNYILRKPI